MDNRGYDRGPQTGTWRLRESELPDERPSVWVLTGSVEQSALAENALSSVFALTLFTSGAALLQALVVTPPDTLLLDWRSSDMAGLDVLRSVRGAYDEVTLPVLMLTASCEPGTDVLDALRVGANDIVTTPKGAELRARVSTLVRIRRLHERARRAEQQFAAARKREERAHEEAEAQRAALHEAFTQAPIGICLLKGKEHVVQFANPVFSHLVGRVELEGKPLREALPELQAQGLIDLLDRVLVTGRRFDGRETPVTLARRGPDTFDPLHFDLVYQPMTNALHYSPKTARVSVETRAELHQVSLIVHNEGPPISDALLPRLFLPMQRGSAAVESNGRSVGLGLFIVDEIVRAHGGSIDVRSTHDKGTTFSVHLPRLQLRSPMPAVLLASTGE